MGINWSAYQSRLTSDGFSDRERIIERTKQQILRKALSNPDCREVLVNKIPQHLFINSTSTLKKKSFNTLPGESIQLGSVVYWNGCHWLVIESVKDDEMTYTGVIQRCNREISWQNPETREIISRWCTIEKPYYANVSKDLEFAFSNREFKIQLPYDYESGLLDVDKRFILDIINGEPKAYVITSVDSNTERYDTDGESIGFLVLNVTQTQYNSQTDNAELGICDYLPPFDVLKPTPEGYLVLEGYEDGIVPGGFPVTIKGMYFNYSDGSLRDESGTIFKFNSAPEVVKALKVKQSKNTVTLQLDYSPEYIGEVIHVTGTNRDRSIGNEADLKVVNAL